MDLTFISIHDLTSEARILYSSESIVDVLGYTPDEVVNRSTWEYFRQEELPYARKMHKRGIASDKAAMLSYCRIRSKAGEWVGCECCFTVVYDVMIVCTSIYRHGLESEKRACEAPVIRRLFSSSPRDPRYHMLSHISQKFHQPAQRARHEPRAALFLNRFTRTLTIMYATSGLADIIGIDAEAMRGRSFYYCISENCLQDAVKCLETAKANDSIAYLRFWFRDPRLDDQPPPENESDDDSDEEMTTGSSVDQDVHGGVQLSQSAETSPDSGTSSAVKSDESMDIDPMSTAQADSRSSSGIDSRSRSAHAAMFGSARETESSASSVQTSPHPEDRSQSGPPQPIELEAVISCTSDGLVVCLRRARPMVPQPSRPPVPAYQNGLFAAPWAREPIIPHQMQTGGNYAPAAEPYNARSAQGPVGGPDNGDFMNSIREQAVFAWALTGINGSLSRFGYGKPYGEAVPADGLPIWESDPSLSDNDLLRSDSGVDDGRYGSAMKKDLFGDPGLDRSRQSSGSGTRSGARSES